MIKRVLFRYFDSGWLPGASYIGLLAAFLVATISGWRRPPALVDGVLFGVAALAFSGLLAATVWSLIRRRWGRAFLHLLFILGSGMASLVLLAPLLLEALIGPSEDGFADGLTIPEGIEIAEPQPETGQGTEGGDDRGIDDLQDGVRKALAVAGGDSPEFTPDMPSLRKAATEHAGAFQEYIEASPDWHVFLEQGNRFAARRWSHGGEPRDSLHGYVSDFDDENRFQTRCLLCLDRRQWSRYSVQHVTEGRGPVQPRMTEGNGMPESRVMIECGDVWVEIFEQSGKPERRVTKATVGALEREFSEFVKDPAAAVAKARGRSIELARRQAGKDGHLFRLLRGMQPGIYGVAYALNPGEPGSVYLKAFEVTKGTPLSAESLPRSSRTRMTWSAEPTERFGAKAGFTIYEGDWGKPYAARFEVWFKPDAPGTERKLAERVFKIEGWQR